MTPLAHEFASDLARPVRDRRVADPAGIGPRITDFHFFEVSEVWQAATDLGLRLCSTEGGLQRLGFLPAPRTWVEFRLDGGRIALALEQNDMHDPIASVFYAYRESPGRDLTICDPRWKMPLTGSGILGSVATSRQMPTQFMPLVGRLSAGLYGALALINTPRVIGRKQHMPHAGLQKKMAAARGMVGKFPLRGWTELTLAVSPPAVDGQEHEVRLTGGKALHFCRAHLRIRLGQVELVKPHWRGDPALGIKQTRYRVAPGRVTGAGASRSVPA